MAFQDNIPDFSQWQGQIDWDTLFKYIPGVIIRCGFGMNQVNQDDWQWARNVAECERLGIPYDAYFYSYSKGESTKSEIDHTLRLLQGHRPGKIWLDLEERACAPFFRTVAEEYCSAMEEAGYSPGIYAGQEFWKGILYGLDRWEKWIPAYGSNYGGIMFDWAKPVYGEPYVAWQYTSTGRFTGVTGDCDVSIFYRDFSDTKKPAVNPTPASPNGSTLELAEGVMRGLYGADDFRKKNLGDRYDEVQGFINHIYTADNYTLADEVLAGKYGNGEQREIVLGSRYDAVQSIVNSRVSPKSADTSYSYTVKPGDTVSGIAYKMNVNWESIAALNNLQSPYVIYPGQILKIN